MKITARSSAYRVLQQVFAEAAYTNLALKQGLQGFALDERDKALCTEIVYGTVQRKRTLDLLLKPYSRRPLSDLDSRILTILRMTVYQLSFLNKIPSYAAINEAVDLAKLEQPKAAGFVNGVLRSFLRANLSLEERLAIVEKSAHSWADQMGIRHSFPTWLVKKWESEYGRERTLRMMVSCNRPTHLSVRVNRRAAEANDVIEELNQIYGDGVATPSPLHPDGIRLSRGLDVEKLSLYREGKITIQDEGAMLIAPLLRPNQHDRILDMCAAPGTKTTHIAELKNDEGCVEACDIHVHKLKLIRQARDRLHLQSIETRLADARILVDTPELHEAFDAVLLDAPCSGFGVLRHRPDIRWKRQQNDVKALSRLQTELLQSAAKLVKPGGVIVYSTCTVLREENDDLVQSLVDGASGELMWDDIREDMPETLRTHVMDGRGLTLTPELYETDGFYMARLKKRAGI